MGADLKARLLIEKLFMRISYSRRVDGLWIGVCGGNKRDAKDRDSLDRVEAALVVIKTYDPIRYARILRDLEGIFVCLLFGADGQFVQTLNRCDLDERHVQSASPNDLASTIVHEATHARLMRAGIGYSEPLRYRVEMICMRRQLAFARKLPESGRMQDQVERIMIRDPSTWSDIELLQFKNNAIAPTGRYLKLPNWAIRLMVKTYARRIAAAKARAGVPTAEAPAKKAALTPPSH